MRIFAHVDPAGQLVFASTYTGPLPIAFWENATFGYESGAGTEGPVRLYYASGTNSGPITDDGGGPVQGEPYWLARLYNIPSTGAYLGLIVMAPGPPTVAYIDGPDLPPPEPFVESWPENPYTFHTSGGASEVSPFVAATEALTSGWLSGARGNWTVVGGLVRNIIEATGDGHTKHTIAVHFEGGVRRIYPRDDSRGGGAQRTFPPSRALKSGNRTSGGYL